MVASSVESRNWGLGFEYSNDTFRSKQKRNNVMAGSLVKVVVMGRH